MFPWLPRVSSRASVGGASGPWHSIVLAAGAFALSAGCVKTGQLCSRACDGSYSCIAGKCLRDGAVLEVAATDRFGQLAVRRIVVDPVAVARIGPGEASPTATVAPLARARDAGAELLLRFAVALPPGATVVDANLLLDRAPYVDGDPAPVSLHAARIEEPWSAGAVTWERAPRLDPLGRAPRTTIDDARRTVRLDVRSLVRRWSFHAADEQGIAVIADQTSPTGITISLADGASPKDEALEVVPVHTPGPPPLFAVAESSAGGLGRSGEQGWARGPRLELYVKP
ncbi:MAG TPA: DNRLRE domain-containing protein [Polyangiaceae bacterium]